ncbi:MAG TPA: HAD family phosphatase, partial [Blastocatellia bacterium]|nr:HAD family phosphatase [Blastocatellia bacterium]
VSNGKPHPEPFLRACTLLSSSLPDGLSPTECLVIEDSIHGVRAAHLAGMRCIAVTTSYSADRLSDADLVVESLAGLSFEKLEALFQL